jgi:hypothetical protein
LFAAGVFLMPAPIKQRVLDLALLMGAVFFRRAPTHFTGSAETPASPDPRSDPVMTAFHLSDEEVTTVGPHIAGPAPSAPPPSITDGDDTTPTSDSRIDKVITVATAVYLALFSLYAITDQITLVCSEY